MVSEVIPLYWKTNLNPGTKWHHHKFVCYINQIQRNPRNGNDGSNASNDIALLLVLTQKRRRYRLTRWSTLWVETRSKSLRADVSKYRPEAYKSEKLKNPKKIHRVALVELLSEIYFLFRFDDYYWPRKIILVSGPPGLVLRVGTVSYKKVVFKIKTN